MWHAVDFSGPVFGVRQDVEAGSKVFLCELGLSYCLVRDVSPALDLAPSGASPPKFTEGGSLWSVVCCPFERIKPRTIPPTQLLVSAQPSALISQGFR